MKKFILCAICSMCGILLSGSSLTQLTVRDVIPVHQVSKGPNGGMRTGQPNLSCYLADKVLEICIENYDGQVTILILNSEEEVVNHCNDAVSGNGVINLPCEFSEGESYTIFIQLSTGDYAGNFEP